MIALRRNIRTPGPISELQEIIPNNNDKIEEIVTEVLENNIEVKNEAGMAIQRVKDHLKEGDCPITCEPLRDSTIVIMKCCGCVLSVEGVEIMIAGSRKLICGNCRTQITRDMIESVDKDISIDDIVNEQISVEVDEFVESKVESTTESTVEETFIDDLDDLDDLDAPDQSEKPKWAADSDTEDDLDEPRNEAEELARRTLQEIEREELTKINAAIYLILGMDEKVADIRQERQDIKIPGLLEGDHDKGSAGNPKKRKILVYNKFKEFFDDIQVKLSKLGISYETLEGTVPVVTEIKRRYHLNYDHPDAINVLFIKGPKYCAGANLQNTHRLIFTHKEMEAATEEQMAGRAARYGRTTNLEIYYILFRNEHDHMFANRISTT
jgi:SNF2 family DNA or RNA helicase